MNVRALVPALVLLTACSREARTTLTTQVTVGGAGSVLVSNGVTIEVADSVACELHSVTTNEGSSRYESLAGHPFGLRAGVFYIGDVEYGPVPSGAVVRVSAEGVFVGAEKRGVVPAAKDEK